MSEHSPPPASGRSPSSLDLLPAGFREWAVAAGWASEGLRPIQIEAIGWFAGAGEADALVCAPTATGKTEAAFIPILGALPDAPEIGFDILYICPLKALINQQKDRLDSLAAVKGRPVTKWHGEAKAGRAAAESRPQGILIITPESLESVLRSDSAARKFGRLSAVIIDEVHSFFGTARGVQVISQLARIEHLTGRTVRRIGLSATLAADAHDAASRFLRPDAPGRVQVVADDTPITALDFRLTAFTGKAADPTAPTVRDQVLMFLRDEVYRPMMARDPPFTKVLVFCNSRAQVEWCATELKPLCKDIADELDEPIDPDKVIFAHHGSLNAQTRREAEASLRDESSKTIAVSSPTLELGLDVGEIQRVVQLDPGPSVSSLRQRLGRSGRRIGHVAKLELLVRDSEADSRGHPVSRLHLNLFQSLAQLHLVRMNRYEPPVQGELNLSTYLQQALSMAAGTVAQPVMDRVLLLTGPFHEASPELYRGLLERLSRDPSAEPGAVRPLLRRIDCDGEPGFALTDYGAMLVGKASFGAAFEGGRLYVVRAGAEILGHMPAGHGLRPGDPIYFGGRRWAVQQVIEQPRTILLRPAGSGRPPRFVGSPIAPSALVVATMRRMYLNPAAPERCEIDETAKRLIDEGAASFRELGLDKDALVQFEDELVIFPWAGARVQATLIAALRTIGYAAAPAHIAIIVPNCDLAKGRSALARIAKWRNLPDGPDLARGLKSTVIDKHDNLLGPALRRRNYAAARFDIGGAKAFAATVAASPATPRRSPEGPRRSSAR